MNDARGVASCSLGLGAAVRYRDTSDGDSDSDSGDSVSVSDSSTNGDGDGGGSGRGGAEKPRGGGRSVRRTQVCAGTESTSHSKRLEARNACWSLKLGFGYAMQPCVLLIISIGGEGAKRAKATLAAHFG